jgi:putative FmdB family regulatory protein
MPIYEYHCPTCEHEFELLMRGEEVAACPTCGNQQLEREFSIPAAHVANGQLPIAQGGGCGLPQCGMGRCGMQ